MNRNFSTSLILLIGAFSLCSRICVSQEFYPSVNSISIDQGLSQNTVMDMIHDANGFLWIGTQDGLNRFDGYAFKVYKSISEDSTTLSNNAIRSLALDNNGDLWIGTQIGLCRYNTKQATFTRFLERESNNINTIINDILIRGDEMWLATNEGLIYCEDINSPGFEYFPVFNEKNELALVSEVLEEPTRDLILRTNKGIFWFDINASDLLTIDVGLDQRVPIHSFASFDDEIWVGSDEGLLSFKIGNLKMQDRNRLVPEVIETYDPFANVQVYYIYEDQEGKIWVSTDADGLYYLNLQEGKQFRKYHDADDLFNRVTIIQIFEDFTNNLWVGTIEDGLYQIKKTSKAFGLIRNGLSSYTVRGILKDGKERLWVGTAKGVNRVDRTTMTFTVLDHDENDKFSISHNDVKDLAMTDNGDIWVATNGGLNRLDTASLKMNRFMADGTEGALIKENRVRTVNALSDGNLWVGTLGGGISVIDPNTYKLVSSFISEPENEKSLSDNHVMHIMEDSNNTIWVATYGGGLCTFDRATMQFTAIKPDELPSLLTSVNEGIDGLLWVGTYGNGFYQLDPETLAYQLYTEEDGLSNNVTYAALSYREDIWLSTNLGLNRFNPQTKTFSIFNVNDGLQSNEFNTSAYYACPSGELFFGGVQGLTFFYPDSITGNDFVPKSAFTDFKIFNRVIYPGEVVIRGRPPLKESIADSTIINLSHFHNSFTIEFTSLDYSNPEDSRYAYRLLGFGSDWNYVNSDQRSVTFTNLEPKSYVFQVKASNDDGRWNDNPITLFIDVRPSLLESLWFRLTLGTVFLGFIGFVIFRQVNKSTRHKQSLEEEIKERTKEISDQNELLSKSETYLKNLNKKKDQMVYILTHNVRAPLTTLVGLLRSQSSNLLEQEEFINHLDNLHYRVRDSLLLLDNAFYWSLIQFEKIDLKREVIPFRDLVEQQIEKYKRAALSKGISMQMACEENFYVNCDRLMTSIIIQNLISNAIKYSHTDSKINIEGKMTPEGFQFIVEDFGVGLSEKEIEKLFDPEESFITSGSQNEKGTGLGLLICRTFAGKMGFHLSVESEKGAFSRFYLAIPGEYLLD